MSLPNYPQQPDKKESFRSKDISIKIQKKLFGSMLTNKTMVKTLFDQDSAQLMDNLHHICKLFCKESSPSTICWPNNNEKLSKLSSKDIADKIIKHLIKVSYPIIFFFIY